MKYLVLVLFLFYSQNLFSLEVTLTQGSVKPTPIAITDFFSKSDDLDKFSKNISNVISDNLEDQVYFYLSIKNHLFKIINRYRISLDLKIGN